MDNESRASQIDVASDRVRDYLRLLASHRLGERYQGKVDASDVVQQALLEAHQSEDLFRGHTPAEKLGWLRQILANIVAETVRNLERAKRDIHREQRIAEGADAMIPAQQSSPSQRAQRDERELRLVDALMALPEAQRDAVVLRHYQGLSLNEIGARLERSPAAVAGLLQRGLTAMRGLLNDWDA